MSSHSVEESTGSWAVMAIWTALAESTTTKSASGRVGSSSASQPERSNSPSSISSTAAVDAAAGSCVGGSDGVSGSIGAMLAFGSTSAAASAAGSTGGDASKACTGAGLGSGAVPEGGEAGLGALTMSRIAAVASEPASIAIWAAVLPEGSSKRWSAPAFRSSLQMAYLFRAAESMRWVMPLASRALRSSPRSIWIRTALSTPAITAIRSNWLRGLALVTFNSFTETRL